MSLLSRASRPFLPSLGSLLGLPRIGERSRLVSRLSSNCVKVFLRVLTVYIFGKIELVKMRYSVDFVSMAQYERLKCS